MGNVEAELLRAIPGLPDTKKKQKEGAASRSRVLDLLCGSEPSKVPATRTLSCWTEL
jgi:hypothetical protein